jgi:hypothetical protein
MVLSDNNGSMLQDMMDPSSEVFTAVVQARNVRNHDTGTLIRVFVSEYAKEKGIELAWPSNREPLEDA